jgi:hypothetical protein
MVGLSGESATAIQQNAISRFATYMPRGWTSKMLDFLANFVQIRRLKQIGIQKTQGKFTIL